MTKALRNLHASEPNLISIFSSIPKLKVSYHFSWVWWWEGSKMKINECFRSTMQSSTSHRWSLLNLSSWSNDFFYETSFKVLARRWLVLTFQEVVKSFFTHFPTWASTLSLLITSMKSLREKKTGADSFFAHMNLLDLEINGVMLGCFTFAILPSFFFFFSSWFIFCTQCRWISSFSLIDL